MRKTLAYCQIAILLVMQTACLHARAVDTRISSAEEAIQRALVFFRNVGWKPEGEATAKFPGRKPLEYAWEVHMGKLTAYVDGKTGQIHNASGVGAFGRQRVDIVGISQSDAQRLAENYLKAAGLSLANTQVYRNELDKEADLWRLRFRRLHNGIPFRRDFIVMDLLPSDGSLDGLGYCFRSPAPKSSVKKVGKDKAIQNASSYMAKLVSPTGKLLSAVLEIVQPNYAWEYIEAGALPPKPTCSRLAWVLQFDAPWEVTELWVDAETEAVLGGDRSLGASKAKVYSISLLDVGTITIKAKRQARLSANGEDGCAFIEAIHGLRVAKASDCKVSIALEFSGKERTYTFGYSPTDHRLVLLEKRYSGKTIKGEAYWETSKEFEDLVAKYAGT